MFSIAYQYTYCQGSHSKAIPGYLKNICLPRTSSYPWPLRWRTRPQPTPAQWFTFIILPSHHYIIIVNKTIEKQKMWRNQIKMINPNLLKNKSYYMNFRHKNTSHILYNSYIKFKVIVWLVTYWFEKFLMAFCFMY